jgi:formate/nitrite transporter FocA (FNT family)
MSEEQKLSTPDIRKKDRAASGAPQSGWAISDRFSWEEIHQRILASAYEEITSQPRELFFSGVTAGFAIILTLIGYAVGSAHFPDNAFLAALLYPIGFMYIILGRYELYTENTLPPVKLVLTRLASLPLLLRLWGIILAANVIGAAIGSLVLAKTHVLSQDAMNMALGFVSHGLELQWWDIFFRALFAGWLVAGVVWISTAARDTISRLIIIYFVFYMIAVCDLFHVVTTASEVLLVIFHGSLTYGLWQLFSTFWLPVLIGNTVGGVMAFSFMAYAQTEQRRYPEVRVLSLWDVLFSMKGGRPFDTPRPRPEWTEKQQQNNGPAT